MTSGHGLSLTQRSTAETDEAMTHSGDTPVQQEQETPDARPYARPELVKRAKLVDVAEQLLVVSGVEVSPSP